jgi:hypothetical protein
MSDAPTTMRAQSSNLENACKPESAIASEFRKPFPASFVSKNRPMPQITFAVPARRTGNIGDHRTESRERHPKNLLPRNRFAPLVELSLCAHLYGDPCHGSRSDAERLSDF